MRRGDVWWANLDPPMGRRPVVLLSRNEAYDRREMVTIAPVTTQIRHIPGEVPLGPADGLPKPCVANLDTIQTVRKNRVVQRLTTLSSEKVAAVDLAIKFSLGLA